MTGLSASVALCLLFAGHNGHLLVEQLDREEIRRDLPVEFALELAPWIRFGAHHRPELPIVFYSPEVLWSSTPDGPLTAARLGPAVNLFAEDYFEGGALRSPRELSINRAQPYFEALLAAHLHLRIEGSYLEIVRERAEEVFETVPPGQRTEAYLEALASFGSDVMTIALQIHRSTRKHRDRGSDLCRFVDSDRKTLYLLWRRDFAGSQYFGQFRNGRGRWQLTAEFLAPYDKQLFVQHVLEGRWTGDPGVDFCGLVRQRDPIPP